MEIIYPVRPDVFTASKERIANLILVDIIIGGITVPVIFDTGGAITVIKETVANSAKIKISDETISGGGNAGGSVTGRLAAAEKIMIGNVTLKDVKIGIAPDEAFDFGADDDGNSVCVNGFLGWDIIQHFKWEFNAANRRFSIGKPIPRETAANMNEWDNMPIMRAHLNGKDRLFGFDSGNTESVIGKTLYSLYEGEQEITDTFVGVDGTKEETIRIINALEIGITNHTIVLHNIPAIDRDVFPTDNSNICGLLGADIIQDRDWVIDYNNRRIEITENADVPT